ncbi:hypothetical protein E4N70_05530 [Treponema vincentii]|uniref:Uncharacterized protein n=1 Tax=Treponema vincentii F0403 TaxID=1125702 RepID=S3MFT2_9SPIR|nr:hypothetical protein [Treponema vincentii]EPF47934.1 hypothetical protein HMPREF1222_00195 [Treponema vincentii F0403]UTC61015.1 hypothetical protein E4N70_05530 [Treponema vincentii]
MKALPYAIFLIFIAIQPLAAAESPTPVVGQSNQDTPQSESENQIVSPTKTSEQQDKTALPAEYRSIKLGMGIDAVKDALKQDSVFGYRGERDVSLLPTENRSLIESAGSYFISRSWFQFYKDNLYTMIFKLNTDTVDYYSVYSKFCEKYGEPASINPQRAVWEDEHTRVVIERPLIVKYIDLTVFNELISQSTTEKAASETNRQNFIDGF